MDSLYTKILKKLDWDTLNYYINNNIIIANKHPEYDLWILNYSPKVPSKKLWDDYTMTCRGLVVDAEGNIIARPLKKFKNWEEHSIEEIPMNEYFEVFEKMDGSLIILFYYQKAKEWIVASRGSFMSDQSKVANDLFNKQNFKNLDVNSTYMFEVIYPENRIVVDYGNIRDLVLLTSIETSTGAEMFYEDLVTKYSKYFTVVKKYTVRSFNDLLSLRDKEEKNKEGFVVRFENGFRVKLKFAEYCRLHIILTNVSNLTIWEHMMNGYDFDELLDRVPDEFYNWLNKTRDKIQINFNEVERVSLKKFHEIFHVNGISNRKEFAEEAKKSELMTILFKLYDCRQYDYLIWKMIRPVYSKPFAHGYNVD